MVDISSRMPMNVGLRFSECSRFGHLVPKLPFLNCLFQAKTSATETSTKGNAIDQFLGIECSSETKCNEAPEEAPSQSMEKFLQFSCYIDKDVKYLHTGLKNRLSMNKTSLSETLYHQLF